MAVILVVDDDRILQGILAVALEKAGHQAMEVTDPLKAYDETRKHAPDAIILDINMPGLSGWEILRKFRGLPAFRQVPVIMLSAEDDVESRVRGLRLGADDYVTKSFANEELLARLDAQLARLERDRKGLRGDLRTHPLIEVIQGLEQNSKTGRLGIVHSHLDGWVTLDRGLLVGASFRDLNDRSALLALIELEEGSFAFDAEAEIGPEDRRAALTVQSLALEAAWLMDELGALKSLLPAPTFTLVSKSSPDEIPDKFASLPISQVWTQIHERESTRTLELLEENYGSPREIKLSLAWLLEQEHVVPGEDLPETTLVPTSTSVSPNTAPTQSDSARSRIEQQILAIFAQTQEEDSEEVDVALREVFQAAMSRGFPLQGLSLGWVVDEKAWPSAARLIAQIPSELLEGRALDRKLALSSRQMTLAHESAGLSLFFSPLTPEMERLVIDRRTIGVFLFWGEILSRSALMITVMKLQQKAPSQAVFLLLARDEKTAQMAEGVLAKNKRWKVIKATELLLSKVLFDLCTLEA